MKINLQNLVDCLRRPAEDRPDAVAVIEPAGRSLTYGKLNDRADRVAAYLHEHGVSRGDRVGLLLPKSIDAVTAIFGILKAGAAYVPVDWRAPVSRAQTIFAGCDAKFLFVDGRLLPTFKSWPAEASTPRFIAVDHPDADASQGGVAALYVDSWTEVLRTTPDPSGSTGAGENDLAYILYTSGSTGVPKGVALTHLNATSFVDWCASTFDLSSEDRFSAHAPFHFDLSVFDLYVSLMHGGSLHLIPDELGKNPKELGPFIASRELTVWYSTPSVLSMLALFGGIDRLSYSGPRLGLFAGEVFPVKHLRNLVSMWPNTTWYNLYGPTETNVCTFFKIPSSVPPDRTEPFPIGEVCSHCRGVILDDDGRQVASGAEGLLYIAGPPVFEGYWNRKLADDEEFRTIDGVRYYNTGDLVREEQDGLIYVGRQDRMVKRRGYRIELGEIESAIYKNPEIREAAVLAIPDADQGVRIIAVLVTDQDRPSIVELKQFCAQHLPDYMSPDVFRFVESLPKTSTDKTDYQQLKHELEQQP